MKAAAGSACAVDQGRLGVVVLRGEAAGATMIAGMMSIGTAVVAAVAESVGLMMVIVLETIIETEGVRGMIDVAVVEIAVNATTGVVVLSRDLLVRTITVASVTGATNRVSESVALTQPRLGDVPSLKSASVSR